VPLPYFLRNSEIGLGWSRSITGLFLAMFIIVYGQIQSWSPQLILGPLRQAPANKHVALLWAAVLAVLPMTLGPVILTADVFQNHEVGGMTAILVVRNSCTLSMFAPRNESLTRMSVFESRLLYMRIRARSDTCAS
jgi:hypothetical protein